MPLQNSGTLKKEVLLDDEDIIAADSDIIDANSDIIDANSEIIEVDSDIVDAIGSLPSEDTETSIETKHNIPRVTAKNQNKPKIAKKRGPRTKDITKTSIVGARTKTRKIKSPFNANEYVSS